jgi:myo-inositol-1(or 4)-monophosphatase
VTDPTQLRDLALEAARAAADLIRERRTNGVRVTDTKTSDVDVVTETDRESEALIRRLVLERRPDDAFLGEESGSAAGSTGVRWVVDPIDGTVNFLYGLPEYSVSIAAEVDGEVVAGVVVNAATGVEYV